MLGATLLIQYVQLVCFTIVFGVLALQRWSDRTRRWLWFSFLANTAGAFFDLGAAHLPAWLSHGLNEEMIPLSYALLNIAIVYFDRRSRKAMIASVAILAAALPLFLLWFGEPGLVRSDALADLLIGLESAITVALLLYGKEQSTRAPRVVMSGFLCFFVVVELVRPAIAFLLHAGPDVYSPKLEIVSAVTYIIDTSLLPLAFIWMMNARLESDLLQQSIVDALTHILNRRGLQQSLEREMARLRRYGGDLTVAMLDLDHFKQLNDAHGHAAGDAVLVGVAELLGSRLRETDVVGRYGGEEFVLLLPHTNEEEAVPILEQLCSTLREYAASLPYGGVKTTASFGVTSTHGRPAVTADELLREADVALYRAKENGRDQVCFISPNGLTMQRSRQVSVLI